MKTLHFTSLGKAARFVGMLNLIVSSFGTLFAQNLYPYYTKFGSYGTGDGQFSALKGLRVDHATGTIYVADANKLQAFTRSAAIVTFQKKYVAASVVNDVAVGSTQLFLGTNGDGPSSSTYSAIDKSTLIYGYGAWFFPGGGYRLPFTSNYASTITAIEKYSDIYNMFIGGSSIYVAESKSSVGNVYTSGSLVLQSYGGIIGSADGQLKNPSGIAYSKRYDKIFVSDAGNNRVQVFNSNGTFLTKFGTVGSGNTNFNNPTGIAVDSANFVYVADMYNQRIQVLQFNGTTLSYYATIGSSGSANGQFNNPYGVAVDKQGQVYVSDQFNYRVQMFKNCRPTIYSQPVGKTVCAGQTHTLSVGATGSDLTYRWYNTSNTAATLATTPTFTPTVSGTYACLVTGACGTSTSTAVTVTVNVPTTSITVQPTNVVVCGNVAGTLSLTATGSNLTYNWVNIANPTVSVSTARSFSTTTPGTYRCTVTGACGTVTSNTATVTTGIPTTITTQPTSQTTCSNTQATLSIAATGTNLLYEVLYNGNVIASSSTITQFPTSTAGSYQCRVTGACGTVTSNTVTVTVNPAPTGVAFDLYSLPDYSLMTSYNICAFSNFRVAVTNPGRKYTENGLYTSLVTNRFNGSGGPDGYSESVTYGSTPGKFAFSFTDPVNGCSTTIGYNITLKPIPAVPSYTTTYPTPFCNNTVSTTQVTNPVGYTNYSAKWSLLQGITNNNGPWTYSETPLTPVTTPTAGGYTFTVPGAFRPTPTYLKLLVTDLTTGCTNINQQALSTTASPWYPQFTVSASPSVNVCKNTAIQITTSNPILSTGFTWTWTLPSGSTCTANSSQNCYAPPFSFNFGGIAGNVKLTATETRIGCVYSASQAITSGNCRTEEEEENQNASLIDNTVKLSIAPNPATNRAQVFYNLGNQAGGVLKVYNVQGSSFVLQQELSGAHGSVELNTEDWSSGVYICTVQAGDAVLSKERLVIAK